MPTDAAAQRGASVPMETARASPPEADRATGDAPSERALDWLNFFMADVRDGVGPYLSVFLKDAAHWQPGAIGLALGAASLSTAACQIPAGMLADSLHQRRLLVAASGLGVALGCLAILLAPAFGVVLGAQILLGAAAALIPPAIAAISLGLVRAARMPARVSRNEAFNHGGNFVAAGLAGGLGQYLGYGWIFYLVCGFALASVVAVRMINPAAIDHAAARGATGNPASGNAASGAEPLSALLRDRRLASFLVAVVLFHFGNAAMLPLAGQVIARAHPGSDVIALSACVIVAQLVMVAVALGVGRAIRAGVGRKPIFLAAFGLLPVRGVLFAFTSSPYAVVGIQVLDGLAAGIFGVLSVVVAADLMNGTGRFNLAQGLVALAVGLGATLSNAASGYVEELAGYPAAFLSLASVAAAGLAFFAWRMPETRPPGAAGARAA